MARETSQRQVSNNTPSTETVDPRPTSDAVEDHVSIDPLAGDGHEASSAPSLKQKPKAPFWRRRPSKQVTVRLCLGIALVIVALLTNPSYLGWGLLVIFAVLFVPITRARSFIMSFLPYAAVWFIFTALRSLANETPLATQLNTHVARAERWLFGGELPTITLQDRWFDPLNLQWYDYFLTGIHWSYFIIPHAVAIRIWHRNPALYRHYLSAMTLLLTVGLFIYFLIPTNPPWLAPESVDTPAAATVTRIMKPIGEELGGGLYTATYAVIGESNPIAAMPSIHMAITFLIVFGMRDSGRRWKLAAWTYSFLMGLALVYLGEHYIVDIAVGMAVTTYGWYATGTWLGRVAPIAVGRLAARRSPAGALPEPSG